MLRASRGQPDGLLAQTVPVSTVACSTASPPPRHCTVSHRQRRWGTVGAGPSAFCAYPSKQRRYGPCRPGPRRPSAFPLFWRSLPAAGSLGSPVRGPVKARQRPTRQTASGATLRSRWSLRALGGLETQSREPASGLVGDWQRWWPARPARLRDSKPPRPTWGPTPEGRCIVERPTTLVGAVPDINIYHIGQRLRRCFFMLGCANLFY